MAFVEKAGRRRQYKGLFDPDNFDSVDPFAFISGHLLQISSCSLALTQPPACCCHSLMELLLDI